MAADPNSGSANVYPSGKSFPHPGARQMATCASGSLHFEYIVVRSKDFTSNVSPSGSMFCWINAAWSG